MREASERLLNALPSEHEPASSPSSEPSERYF